MSEATVIETAAGPCRLLRRNRRTLAIAVQPNGQIEVAGPMDAPVGAIVTKVDRKLRWIIAQRRRFELMNAKRPARRYVSGATHRYLGKQYRLKVVSAPEPSVKLRGAHIEIATPDTSPSAVEVMLRGWYRDRSRLQFGQRMAGWLDWCEKHGVPKPKVLIRMMPKRWGSTHPSGEIRLNPELVRAPSACIDYVIAHEICHLKFPSHSKRFFMLLDQLAPDWRIRKHRLETME